MTKTKVVKFFFVFFCQQHDTPMPTIRLERSATAISVEETKVIADARFDPKGKSVASGKNITGWL
jgi:hypothetical protein